MVHRSRLALVAGVLSLSVAARAQCANEWLPGDGLPGVSGTIHCVTLRDPDGAGPLPPRVLVAGAELHAGKVGGTVVEWDRSTGEWSRLAGDLVGTVHDVGVLPGGGLVAAGSFLFPGGLWHAAARWDGVAWSPIVGALGTGEAVQVLPSGNVAIGGLFEVLDASWNVLGRNLVAWDGAGVSFPFGDVSNRIVDLALSHGQLIARGNFVATGGVPSDGLARWTGSAWVPMGVASAGLDWRDAMDVLPNGDLVCLFYSPVPPPTLGSDVGVWDGAAWTALPPTNTNPLFPPGLIARGNGEIVVTAPSAIGARVLALAGAGWVDLPIEGAVGPPLAEDANGDLLVHVSRSESAVGLVRWDGATASSLGSGIFGPEWSVLEPMCSDLARLPDGDLVACGLFKRIGDTTAHGVARFDGSTWSPLGAGVDGTPRAIAALPNGDVVVAGEFTVGASTVIEKLARWDGVAWSPMSWPGTGSIEALCALPNGDLVVAGSFYLTPFGSGGNILRWDGASWSQLGNGARPGVRVLAAAPDGSLFVGGEFVEVDGAGPGGTFGMLALRVARWSGSAWSALGGSTVQDNGVNGVVDALTVLANGDIVVGGTFTVAGGVPAVGVARWDGTAWHAMGNGVAGCTALVTLPNGDVVAAGTDSLQRWDGTAWQPLMSAYLVRAMQVHGSGLTVGGQYFAEAGTVGGFAGFPNGFSIGFAHLATTCPAAAASVAPGCQGATLEAVTLPWVDSALRTYGNGLPSPSLALAVTGFQAASPAVPLASLLPQGAPGCALHVVPDVLQLVAVDGGTATNELFVPSVPSIVGLPFRQQLLAFELDSVGAITSVVATNALKLQAGQF